MTQDIYEVITQELLEHRILRSILEPLPLSDLMAQTLIVPLGVLLHQELEEVGVHWTPNYLLYRWCLYDNHLHNSEKPLPLSNLRTRRSRRKLEYTITAKTKPIFF